MAGIDAALADSAEILELALSGWREQVLAMTRATVPPAQPRPLAVLLVPGEGPERAVPDLPVIGNPSGHRRLAAQRATREAGDRLDRAAILLHQALGAAPEDGPFRLTMQGFLHEAPAFTLSLPAYGFARRFSGHADLSAAIGGLARPLAWRRSTESSLPRQPDAETAAARQAHWTVSTTRPLLPGLSCSIIGTAVDPERMLRDALVAAALRNGSDPASVNPDAIAGLAAASDPGPRPVRHGSSLEGLRAWLRAATART